MIAIDSIVAAIDAAVVAAAVEAAGRITDSLQACRCCFAAVACVTAVVFVDAAVVAAVVFLLPWLLFQNSCFCCCCCYDYIACAVLSLWVSTVLLL